ncbi:MAG TPA: cytochrome c-type biogenesis CcmF C-terminal domain-containing protein, partial [Steroidobacteraceae bacterium]|nr:cytochrome c-type biogenesis CcmF C-terminal domain-containing protein [Steroidobacteraceae bacterium]
LGTFARWKRGALRESRQRILGSLVLAVLLGAAISLGIYGSRALLAPLGVILGVWIIGSALIDPVDRLRRGLSIAPAVLGMTLAHIGLGVITIGLTTMEYSRQERDIAMAPGQQVELPPYTFRLQGIEDVEGPNYKAAQARLEVLKNGQPETVLLPERRDYWVQQQSLAEAALGVSWRRDLLATMGDKVGQGAWSLRVQVRPLMRLLWLGAALMALGGFLATLDRRYRRQREVVSAPAADAAASPPVRGAEA